MGVISSSKCNYYTKRDLIVSYKVVTIRILFLVGHYVPQLAQLIVKTKAKINLKGIAVSTA